MKKFVLALLILVPLSLPAMAQKIEIYGGYQFTHLQSRYNGSGWNLALTRNFKHFLGITGDFSGSYKSSADFHSYTFGPVLTARLPVVQPFVHALFGGATLSGSGITNSGFAMFVGGGMDVGLRRGIGFRVFQADWLRTHFEGNANDNNGRISAGIVLKF
jgi:hypothetical protein